MSHVTASDGSDDSTNGATGPSSLTAGHSLLQCNFVAESLKRISPLQLFQLYGRMLVQKFINREEAASDSDLNFVLLNPYSYLLRAEFVHS